VAHRLIFAPQVPDDLATSAHYYEQISSVLADDFRQQLNDRFDDIAERPESFPFDEEPVRFARVARFPYLIFFVARQNSVSIIAVLHGASDPTRWRSRRGDSEE
jgi:plasmid stabilization system protein ParE